MPIPDPHPTTLTERNIHAGNHNLAQKHRAACQQIIPGSGLQPGRRPEIFILPFHQLSGLLANKKLTKKDLVDCIVKAEYSEFNYVFLYVVKTLGEISNAFQHVAATIETHEKRIRSFLNDVPEGRAVIRDDFDLPQIWNKKILVVDDEPTIREIISETLKKIGAVTTAADGREALAIL
jgi:hypothetical protein